MCITKTIHDSFDLTRPKAWMGYTVSQGKPMIRVCAWCESHSVAESIAKAEGHLVTHGICPECSYKLMEQRCGPS